MREISYLTSLEGRARDFIEGRGIIEDGLTLYFTDYAPESCLVAEYEGKVIGYIVGTVDVRRMSKVIIWKIMPALCWEGIRRAIIFQRKNMVFLVHCLQGLCRGELRQPRFDREFPATFHLNILEEFRSKGIGAECVRRYLSLLQSRGIQGVHIGTMSERAKGFFLRLGFQVLQRFSRNYLRYILGRNVTYYMLGKKL